MNYKIIATIEGWGIGVSTDGSNIMTFTAKAAIDNDGTEDRDHDPDHQNDTNLHFEGKPLDAYKDKFIVLPMKIFKMVKPILLGSHCHVTNMRNGKESAAVIGDKGPNNKLGEISPALAEALGLDPNARHGGTDAAIIQYEVQMGVAANVDGKQYELQPS